MTMAIRVSTPLSLASLHHFFHELSTKQPWAVLLGGSVEVSTLNQWVVMGFGTRQTSILESDTLKINGVPISEPLTSESLFVHWQTMQQQAKVWPQPPSIKSSNQSGKLPMQGGLFGCFGYNFYRWCDSGWSQTTEQASDWPDAILCEFEDWLYVHLESGQLVVLTDSEAREKQYLEQWQHCQRQHLEPCYEQCAAPEDYLHSFDTSLAPAEFEQAVEQLKQDIRQGEIYQANLSLRLQKEIALDPYTLFQRLCQKNPSAFAGLFKWPGGYIVSNSPERLVQVDSGGQVQTRPIAGTRGRGQNLETDISVGQSLLENEKERAEHLMLVDLARHDLGRLCQSGSVQVNELLMLERYSHVTHLVSNVQGTLNPNVKQWDVLSSLFPGGTITGCPKIRCVDILDTLEPVSRGFYTGSFGYFDAASRALDLNILIRSVFLKPTSNPLVYNAAVHVGAGIVYDAVGRHEYRECLRKATAILNELYALECESAVPQDK